MTTIILLSILSSIFAAIIISAFVAIWKYAKTIIVQRIVFGFLDVGISQIYNNRTLSEEELFSENINTSKLKIMTNRGLPFCDPSMSSHPLQKWLKLENAQMLIINPESKGAERRANEIGNIATRDWKNEYLYDDIWKVAIRAGNLEKVNLRFHNEESIFRLIITSDYAYISGFLADDFGKNVQVIKVDKHSFLYSLFERYFDLAWEKSTDPNSLSTRKSNLSMT